MDVDTTKASQSDKVEDTVDYKKLQEFIKTVIEGKHHALIEKIACIIADKILEDTRVHSCEVTIKKLDAFDIGLPGVTLRRKQKLPRFKKVAKRTLATLIQTIDKEDVHVLPLLSPELCKTMKEVAYTQPFAQADTVYSANNTVTQHFSYCRDYPQEHYLWLIAQKIEKLLQENIPKRVQYIFEPTLSFTEISAQYYEPQAIGISLHKDESRYRNMIVICVIEGDAEFRVITSSGEKVLNLKVGDVIFMRAPGFMGKDLRPQHAVHNITSPRLTITLRQELPRKAS